MRQKEIITGCGTLLILIVYAFFSLTTGKAQSQQGSSMAEGGNGQIIPLLKQQQMIETPSYHEAKLLFKELDSYFSGDTLHLSFQLHIIGDIIGFDEALHLVPVYSYGSELLPLPEILLQDEARNQYYRREQALMSKEDYLAQKPYRLVVINGKRTDEIVPYHASIQIPASIKKVGATLKIYQLLQDCCRWHELGAYEMDLAVGPSTSQVKTHIHNVVPTPPRLRPEDMMFIRPVAEQVKMRTENITVRIQFRVAKHDILPTFGQNYIELSKIDKLLAPILLGKTGDIEVREASIKGYASPEGGFDYNQKLSQRRADSFKQYLIQRYGGLGQLSSFPAIGMGEDWEGLRIAVANDPAQPMKMQVLSIIDYVDLFAGREKQLMDLGGGTPYKYMLHHLFPQLRRMEMEVKYTVRAYQPSEVEEVFKERPQDLSQAEIYEVAQRDTRRQIPTSEFGRAYDVAAHYFPEDLIANLNASSAALVRGELDLAWTYLRRIEDHIEAATNLGLYYWNRDDVDLAKKYFTKALNDPRQANQASKYLKDLEEAPNTSEYKTM